MSIRKSGYYYIDIPESKSDKINIIENMDNLNKKNKVKKLGEVVDNEKMEADKYGVVTRNLSYRGTQNRSVDGNLCLPWGNSGVKNKLKAENSNVYNENPKLKNISYCRNDEKLLPLNKAELPLGNKQPFCYIMKDNKVEPEYCTNKLSDIEITHEIDKKKNKLGEGYLGTHFTVKNGKKCLNTQT